MKNMKFEMGKKIGRANNNFKKTNNNFILLLAILILVAAIMVTFILGKMPVGRVIDSPPTIHQFYGTVNFVNGTSMPDGTRIYTRINGILKTEQTSLSGKYGYTPHFLIEDAINGDDIIFYIESNNKYQNVINYTFANFGLTELNLVFNESSSTIVNITITCPSGQTKCSDGVCRESCQTSTSETSSGGGGSGGGGGVGIPVSQTYIVSSSDLITGYSRDLSVNDKFQFILDGIHYSKLSQIRGDEISMVIGSENVVIDLGGEDLVDINSDGKADISLKLNSISGSKANVKIQAVYNNENYGIVPGCAANWSCGSWSICINGKKMRNCVDVNNCNNLENKPVEVGNCYEIRSYIMVGVIIILILGIIVVAFFIVRVLIKGKKDKKTLLMGKINSLN